MSSYIPGLKPFPVKSKSLKVKSKKKGFLCGRGRFNDQTFFSTNSVIHTREREGGQETVRGEQVRKKERGGRNKAERERERNRKRWKTGKLISLSAPRAVAAAGSMSVIRPGTESHFLFHLRQPEPERP